MAFLCPVRIRRNKKKKANSEDADSMRSPVMGRITGSASIETLVRVGIEKEHGLSPESRMVVLHDFSPCVDDELNVKRGTVINVLYQDNDWVYVISEASQQEGFIPYSYCAPYGSHLADLAMSVKKKLPRDLATLPTVSGGGQLATGLTSAANELEHMTSAGNISSERHGIAQLENSERYRDPVPSIRGTTVISNGRAVSSAAAATTTSTHHIKGISEVNCTADSAATVNCDVHPFFKDPSGRYIVLYTFLSRDENDVSVERGEFVTVLNKEDPDWYWIERSDGQEGFVPSAFVYPADVLPGETFWSRTAADPGRKSRSNAGSAGDQSQQGSSPGQLPISAQSGAGECHTTSTPASTAGHMAAPAVPEDMHHHGSELVMLYDYKAQAPDDLSVRRGDWIYADLNGQTVEGWLWVYSPKSRKHGFIPKAYARPPAMTSL